MAKSRRRRRANLANPRRRTLTSQPAQAAVSGPVPVVERGYSFQSLDGVPEDHEQTPELRWPQSIEVYDRMRSQDGQVVSVLEAVTLPVLSTQWSVDPNGARDEVVEFIANNLGLPITGQEPKPKKRQRDRFDWLEHLRIALSMLAFGHAFFEQVYRIDSAGRAQLRKLGWRPPRTISRIDVAPDGGLVAIEQYGLTGKEHRMTVDRLVAYVNRREGGNWLGRSLLRPAYKHWLLKDRLIRVQAQTVDRNGMGVPVYTASQQPGTLSADEQLRRAKEELAEGQKVARAFRSGDSSGAAIPNGAKLELLGVQGTLPNADPVVRYHDEQIARAVLAHFLNLGTQTGSWALGETFADFFIQSLTALASYLRDTATAHVVEDLVDVNWGPDEPAPRITYQAIGAQQPATHEAVQSLVDCGAITPDDSLEQYLRSRYGLPAADPNTRRTATNGGTNA